MASYTLTSFSALNNESIHQSNIPSNLFEEQETDFPQDAVAFILENLSFADLQNLKLANKSWYHQVVCDPRYMMIFSLSLGLPRWIGLQIKCGENLEGYQIENVQGGSTEDVLDKLGLSWDDDFEANPHLYARFKQLSNRLNYQIFLLGTGTLYSNNQVGIEGLITNDFCGEIKHEKYLKGKTCFQQPQSPLLSRFIFKLTFDNVSAYHSTISIQKTGLQFLTMLRLNGLHILSLERQNNVFPLAVKAINQDLQQLNDSEDNRHFEQLSRSIH